MATTAARTVSADGGLDDLHAALFAALDVAVVFERFPDRRVLDANPAFAGLFGVDRAEIVGASTERFHVDRDHFLRFGEAVRPALAQGGPLALEFPFRRRDGTVFSAHVALSPVAPRTDGPVGVVGVLRDLTGAKAAGREDADISRMRAQLVQGEKLSALGSLVSGVAHEVRTPLTFLANNAFLVQQRFDRAARRGATAREALDETAPFLREITSGVDRINQLVEDLRRYTKARQDATFARGPLNAIVSDAVELFRATNRGAHPVETSLSPTSPVLANKGGVQQIVLNLMQNAAEASPPGSSVRVVTRDEEEGVALEVVDRGVGIPPAVRQRMFEPLFTTKRDGTGLGLSIVQRLVDEHGARIACESVPGDTRFKVTFRRA